MICKYVQHSIHQVWMMDKKGKPLNFKGLDDTDRDLTMFTITNLVLTNEDLTLTNEKNASTVHMTLKLKRKVTTELLTTYLPTILLLLITLVTIFFGQDQVCNCEHGQIPICIVQSCYFSWLSFLVHHQVLME